MKKRLSLLLATATIVSVSALSVSAAQPVTVTVNGTNLVTEQSAYIENQRTMVPMRAIFEALGTQVEWDAEDRAITATGDGTTVHMAIGSTEMTVNDETVTLDTAPVIVNNTTMVPARAVAESFGADVTWDEANRQVLISTYPTKTLSESVKAEDGKVLMNIEAVYPVLDNPDNDAGIAAINAAFQKSAEDYIASVKSTYQTEAESFYTEFKDEATFFPYTFSQTISLTWDNTNGDLISGVTTNYSYTGGAHPNTVKTGFIYSTDTGKLLTLDNAVEGADQLRTQAVALFQAAIDANPEGYFEDAKQTVEDGIAKAQCYLDNDGVHFLFQVYELAPYAAGFQEVTVPWPEV
jgi:hypothetical protein